MVYWIVRHLLQIYLTVAFIIMGVINIPPYDIPLPFPAVWPGLLTLTGSIIGGTVVVPLSRPTLVLAQSLLVLVGSCRALALAAVIVTSEEPIRSHSSLLVSMLLWGVVVLIGWRYDDITLKTTAEDILHAPEPFFSKEDI